MNTAWSLGRRITALVATAATVLGLLAVGAAVTAATNRRETSLGLDQLGPALGNSERLYASLVREQSGLRTFALTGKSTDLDTFTTAVDDEKTVVASAERYLAGRDALLGQLHRASAATADYRSHIADPIIAAIRARGTGDPSLATPNDDARTYSRAATDAITTLQTSLTRERDASRTRSRRTADIVILLLVSASIVVIVAGVVLSFLMRRLVTRPVVQLADEVRLVASGDYRHEIEGGGPPELANLAHDVNAMRSQIVRDLGEVEAARRQVEEANNLLERQAEELTRSNRDLEQFAYVASHDLQEPLRKVASFCQLLHRRYAGQLDERADQYIQFAVDGAQRMQRLINDLLAFSRIGRVTGGFADVDLNKVVGDAMEQSDALREQTGAEITSEELPVVHGEEALLGALFANLIGNALKFRAPDRPPRVHISVRQEDDRYEISCRDNGIGIAPEFTDKVFVIFQRLHPKETYQGTGIGLAIAKKIVEYHGGQIWIDTEYRDGTLFRFTLPVTAAVETPSQDPSLVEETVS